MGFYRGILGLVVSSILFKIAIAAIDTPFLYLFVALFRRRFGLAVGEEIQLDKYGNDKAVRINKYLSEIGYCSRRAADKLILEGRISVNGTPVEMGVKVVPADRIAVDGVVIDQKADAPVYIAFHKPVGIVCTTDTRVRKTTLSILQFSYADFPVDDWINPRRA